jgi:hypothetical protein
VNNFPYPNITGKTEKEQLEQVKRYLFQLVDMLNHSNNAASTSSAPKNTKTGG